MLNSLMNVMYFIKFNFKNIYYKIRIREKKKKTIFFNKYK